MRKILRNVGEYSQIPTFSQTGSALGFIAVLSGGSAVVVVDLRLLRQSQSQWATARMRIAAKAPYALDPLGGHEVHKPVKFGMPRTLPPSAPF